MDRSGALPDRCVVCNADAGGYHLARKLYWSPFAWRLGAVATPFVVLGLGAATQTAFLMLLFWPLLLLVMIVHTFVRKKLELELGICQRHRRMRASLRALSIACVVGLFGSPLLIREFDQLGMAVLWTLIAALACLAAAQSYVGVQAIAIRKLSEEHAWLARTGKAFRAALPELPD